jgi:hypothetical protein
MIEHDVGYWTGHVLSGLAILGWAAGIIPWLATLAALIYYCMLIYNRPELQAWRNRRKRRAIARLQKEIDDLKHVSGE